MKSQNRRTFFISLAFWRDGVHIGYADGTFSQSKEFSAEATLTAAKKTFLSLHAKERGLSEEGIVAQAIAFNEVSEN